MVSCDFSIISKYLSVPVVTALVFCFRIAVRPAAAAPDPRLRVPPPIGGRLPPRLGPTGRRTQEAVARRLYARAGLRAGAPLQPAALPQRTRKGRPGRRSQAHRDPGGYKKPNFHLQMMVYFDSTRKVQIFNEIHFYNLHLVGIYQFLRLAHHSE